MSSARALPRVRARGEDLGAGVFGGLTSKERRRAFREGIEPLVIECEGCGEPFVSLEPDGQYCGRACALSAVATA